MTIENVYIQNARRLATIGLQMLNDNKEENLSDVTAAQAEKILKVPRERIAQVLTPHPMLDDFGARRREKLVPRYDITLIEDVLNHRQSHPADECFYVIAEHELELLQADEAPSAEQVSRYQHAWACNVFRNPHYMPMFRTKAIAEEILKKSVLRRIAWASAEELEDGFEYGLGVAYGEPEADQVETSALIIGTAVPPCEEAEMDVEDYRQALLDMLMMDLSELDEAMHSYTLWSDEVFELKSAPEFQQRLEDIYGDEDVQQDWLELLKACPSASEEQILCLVRKRYRDLRLVKSLTPHQLIVFLFLFGSVEELKKELKAKARRNRLCAKINHLRC